MKFTKMHGAGNDYIYVDCFRQPPPVDPAATARLVSDRHTGIGADGLILIGPSDRADARMQMWNADGSRGEMCGNGIRCVAKYVYERGIARSAQLRIETDCGVHEVTLELSCTRVDRVRVNMGVPILRAREIPVTLAGDPPVAAPLSFVTAVGLRGVERLLVTCVSMGNPHCVVFAEEVDDEALLNLGPAIECHPAFPKRTNVEFVRVVSPSAMRVRVWERGTGETQACGTGACAAVVAGVLSGHVGRRVAVQLPGGELQVEWSEEGHVFLTGPAEEVFQGEWPRAA